MQSVLGGTKHLDTGHLRCRRKILNDLIKNKCTSVFVTIAQIKAGVSNGGSVECGSVGVYYRGVNRHFYKRLYTLFFIAHTNYIMRAEGTSCCVFVRRRFRVSCQNNQDKNTAIINLKSNQMLLRF